MQAIASSAFNILRGYTADNLNASTDSAGSARIRLLQNSTKALETLREQMTTSAEAAKERAARKLEESKQELQMLKSGSYPPEVVARLAAELAHKIGAAAAEFASAVALSANSVAPATSADATATTAATGGTDTTAAATNETATADADTSTADASADASEDTDDATVARNAYQSVMDDGKQASQGISADDREMLREFQELLQEVRQLMDKAMRDLRAGRISNGAAAPLSAQTAAAPIPTSITI